MEPSSNPQRSLAERLIRNFHDVQLEHFEQGQRYESDSASLARGTAARKLGASVDELPPGKMSCPYHLHHMQEEMFIVVEGRGTLRVADERLPIRAGDVIFIPPGPEYPHHIVNTSDAPLKFLSISTREYPEICEYPDSGKYAAYVGAGGSGGGPVFDAIQRQQNSLDYWDGEEGAESTV